MTKQIKKICCIGAGYVGGPSMAIIAEKCPHILINVVDKNKDRIEKWNNTDLEKLPIFEPGLKNIIKKCRNKNLFFSTKIKENLRKAKPKVSLKADYIIHALAQAQPFHHPML